VKRKRKAEGGGEKEEEDDDEEEEGYDNVTCYRNSDWIQLY
jgi:hypothetical protein